MMAKETKLELKKLRVSDLGYPLPPHDPKLPTLGKIFINESLTNRLKNLLRLTKLKKRELEYKYVWSRNGKIYLRKDDNANAVLINFATDLDKLE